MARLERVGFSRPERVALQFETRKAIVERCSSNPRALTRRAYLPRDCRTEGAHLSVRPVAVKRTKSDSADSFNPS